MPNRPAARDEVLIGAPQGVSNRSRHTKKLHLTILSRKNDLKEKQHGSIPKPPIYNQGCLPEK